MTRPTQTVGHVNSDGNMFGLNKLAGHRPMALGGCEMSRVGSKRSAQIPGYVAFYGGEGHPSRRARDTVAYRRKQGTIHMGTMGLLTSHVSSPEKVAGLPRFPSGTLFRSEALEMNIAFWEIHNHWIGPANDNPGEDRVEETDAGMRDFQILLDGLERMGYANIVVGDINIPKRTPSPGWKSTWEVFEDLDFAVRSMHLDGAGVSPKLRITDLKEFSKEEMKSDHPGFLLEVSKR